LREVQLEAKFFSSDSFITDNQDASSESEKTRRMTFRPIWLLPLTIALQAEDDEDEDERPRQRPNLDSDEERDMAHMVPEDSEPTADEQLAKKLIRYAMACDYARVAIRRDGIKDKGRHGRFLKPNTTDTGRSAG
jgi:hypothetical protein